MKSFTPRPLVLAAAVAGLVSQANASSFVYEGVLEEHDRPASGRYDLRLSISARETDALPHSTIDFPAVDVVDGRFRVDFDLPAGGIAEPWIGVAVRAAGEVSYAEIPGRRKAVSGAICWDTAGNSSTNSEFDFLGTTDNEPLVLRTRNTPALRLEPAGILAGPFPITANVLAGSVQNTIGTSVRGGTVSGGGSLIGDVDPDVTAEGPNEVFSHYSTIGGGINNQIGTLSGSPVIGAFAFIGGGSNNLVQATNASIGGGNANTAAGSLSTIGGGFSNYTEASSTVVGGFSNAAVGFNATVGAGSGNCAGGDYSWVGGRSAQVRPAVARTQPGCVGVPEAGVTGGDQGSFVWADSSTQVFRSSGRDQFLARARGGVAFNTNAIPAGVDMVVANATTAPNANTDFLLRSSGSNTGINLSLQPGPTMAALPELRVAVQAGTLLSDLAIYYPDGGFEIAGQAFKPGGGSWAMPSDARLKHRVAPLTGTLDRLLELQGVSFEYRDPDPAKRPAGVQIGFIAQDVQKLFPDWVSKGSDGFLMLGPRGFEALTVEALRELRAESATIDTAQSERLAVLEARNAALIERIARLERALGGRVSHSESRDEH